MYAYLTHDLPVFVSDAEKSHNESNKDGTSINERDTPHTH